MNFEDEIMLSPFFNIWDRGDGIGEITSFNRIIGYIHGERPIYSEDYFHYDPETETYVEDDVEFVPISCFPGVLSSNDEKLKPFNDMQVECVEHLSSLIHSIDCALLPEKPKGSVFDIFSQKDKFLLSRNFDFDIIKNGMDFSPVIRDNFMLVSHYMKNYFQDYPEVDIQFSSHSYLNGNIYFLYLLNDKYCLHLVFNPENQMILGAINKSSQMKDIVVLDCCEKNYLFICQEIVSKLGISKDIATIKIQLTALSMDNIPRGKNQFLHTLISTYLDSFIHKISNSSVFIVQRSLGTDSLSDFQFSVNRELLLTICKKIAIFDLKPVDFISLCINDYFNTIKKSD